MENVISFWEFKSTTSVKINFYSASLGTRVYTLQKSMYWVTIFVILKVIFLLLIQAPGTDALSVKYRHRYQILFNVHPITSSVQKKSIFNRIFNRVNIQSFNQLCFSLKVIFTSYIERIIMDRNWRHCLLTKVFQMYIVR